MKYWSRKSPVVREPMTAVMPVAALERGKLTVGQAVAIGALAIAHFFDWATFLVMMSRHGLAAEANPIVIRIAQAAGIPGLTLAKIATVAFASALMLMIAPRRPKLAYALVVFGVLAGVVGGFSNIASL